MGLTPAILFGGAAAWAIVILASMFSYELLLSGLNTFHLSTLAMVFGCGGMIGWLTAVPVARWLSYGRSRETRLAAYVLGLTLATIGFTAFLFSMEYRIFYSRWHGQIGSAGWIIAFAETGVVSNYQFLVLGLPHFLPLAFPALFLASNWLVKAMR